MKTILNCLPLLLLLTACKGDESEIYKRLQVSSTVFLNDELTSNLAVAAPSATVYLARNEKADPYLYQTIADDRGKFTLSGLPEEKSGMYVVGKFKNAAGIHFMGSKSLTEFNDGTAKELELKPQYPGGALRVELLDETANNQPVAGAEVFLFTTERQTKSAVNDTPEGLVQPKAVTNAKGIAFFHSLQPVKYYVVAKTKVDGKVILSSTEPVSVTSSAAITRLQDAVPVKLTYPVRRGSIELTVTDSLQAPVADFNAYLFTNPLQAQTIRVDTGPTGYIQNHKTNFQGKVTFSGLEPGRYYIAIKGIYTEKRTMTKIVTRHFDIRVNDSTVLQETTSIN